MASTYKSRGDTTQPGTHPPSKHLERPSCPASPLPSSGSPPPPSTGRQLEHHSPGLPASRLSCPNSPVTLPPHQSGYSLFTRLHYRLFLARSRSLALFPICFSPLPAHQAPYRDRGTHFWVRAGLLLPSHWAPRPHSSRTSFLESQTVSPPSRSHQMPRDLRLPALARGDRHSVLRAPRALCADLVSRTEPEGGPLHACTHQRRPTEAGPVPSLPSRGPAHGGHPQVLHRFGERTYSLGSPPLESKRSPPDSLLGTNVQALKNK